MNAAQLKIPMDSTSAVATPDVRNLTGYMHLVMTIPVLDAAEEKKLALKLRDEQDLGAAQQLVLANLRHVVHIARGYLGYGLPFNDLIQEGNIGLMKAVKRFDPDVGVRLISFAVHWVKAEIHEFVLKNWRIVKIATTKAQRKLFFNLRRMKDHSGWMNPAEVNAMAQDLKVKPEEVLQMEARLSGRDTSFNATPADGEDAYVPEDYLRDENDPYAALENVEWQDEREDKLRTALTTLDARSRDILHRRWLAAEGAKEGLKELAEKYGVSAERVRQIETAALKKLRAAIEA